MKKIAQALCFAAIIASPTSHAAATQTSWGKIILHMTGWGVDDVRVQLTGAVINPANCSIPDGYMTDETDSGNHAHQSALLAAYASGKDVSVVIDGCNSVGRPKIVGVGLR